MERKRILVAYYSRTGHTRQAAEAIANALGADVEEIDDRTDRSGVLGYLRCALETILGVSAELGRPARDPGDYDVVVVGSPIWAWSVSTPVRTYLWLQRERLPRVAFFVTMGGVWSARVLGQMTAMARKPPLATVAFRERDLAHGVPEEQLQSFASAVRRRVTNVARRSVSRARREPRAARLAGR